MALFTVVQTAGLEIFRDLNQNGQEPLLRRIRRLSLIRPCAQFSILFHWSSDYWEAEATIWLHAAAASTGTKQLARPALHHHHHHHTQTDALRETQQVVWLTFNFNLTLNC